MSRVPTAALHSFREELSKLALHHRFRGLLSGLGALGGTGAGLGALGGAAYGGYKGYQDAKEQGQGTGGAVASGALGALQGGLTGGTVGALGAGAVGAVGGAISPGTAETVRAALTKTPVVGSAARFGQRQVHGLTGWLPREGDKSSIREIGLGLSDDVVKHHAAAEEALVKARSAGKAKDIAKAEKGLERANNSVRYSKEVEEKGLTSIPGYLRHAAEDPADAVSTGFKYHWSGMRPRDALLPLAFTLPMVPEVLSKEDPTGEGRSRLERFGHMAGNLATAEVMPLPMLANQVASSTVGSVGGRIGRAISPRRAPTQPNYDPSMEHGAEAPVEYMSRSAENGGMYGSNQ